MSATPETVDQQKARAASPSVLIVDDAPVVRDMFGRYLGFAGMAVRYAADGHEGLAAARASRPDLILCDLDVPGMNAVALCQALRAEPATADIPVLVVSASTPTGFEAAVAAGCDGVLAKPCSQTLLVATIRQLLTRGPRASTA